MLSSNRPRALDSWIARSFVILTLALAACSDDGGTGGTGTGGGGGGGGGGGDKCSGLCTNAGFSGGNEVDYGGGVIECTCEGTGDGIVEADCDAYCVDFDVSAENALLSSEASPNDKCVCDGTSEP